MRCPNCAITDLKTGLVSPEWLKYFDDVASMASTRLSDDAGDTTTPTPPPTTSTGGGGTSIIVTGPDVGSGTIGRLAKWVQTKTLGDSIAREAGTLIAVDGTLSAFTLQGDGSAVTNLNASELKSGIVPPARIPVSASHLLGRGASAAGPMEEITLGTNLSITGTTLNATGTGGGGAGGMNLDYLGNYAAGPTYNDGDIVIATDGIAYMCVVDGTTTPPEPWPGVGIATSVGPPGPVGPAGPPGPAGINAAVDATYWTVMPHSTLVNERALNQLANGYVKSTAGEPSTVAIIPVGDGGTGANNPTTARTNLGCGSIATVNLNSNPGTFLNGNGVFAVPPSVPSGLIAIFATACPAGWTRVAGWDGRFLRAAAAYGLTGGSDIHSHAPGSLTGGSHTHGVGSYAGPDHNHGGGVTISGNTTNDGLHSHPFSGSGVGTTAGSNQGSMNVDAGGSGVMSRYDHQHNFGVSVSGDTNTNGEHHHSYSGSAAIPRDGGQGITGTSGASTVPITGAVEASSNVPAFIDVVFCQKD